MKSSTPFISVLQFNENHDMRAHDLCLSYADQCNANVVVLSDPYTRNGEVPSPGWSCQLENRTAILIRNPLSFSSLHISHSEVTGIRIFDINFVGIYSPPQGDLSAPHVVFLASLPISVVNC